MKKITLFLSIFFMLGLASQVEAQPYKNAIGLRFGYPLSLSYKWFTQETKAIELFAGFRSFSGYSYVSVGGLYEIEKAIPDVEGLSWYYGFGANVQFWNYDFDTDESSFSFGLSGVIGLEYVFPDAPLDLALDFIPTFIIGGYDTGYYSWGALSARYILNR